MIIVYFAIKFNYTKYEDALTVSFISIFWITQFSLIKDLISKVNSDYDISSLVSIILIAILIVLSSIVITRIKGFSVSLILLVSLICFTLAIFIGYREIKISQYLDDARKSLGIERNIEKVTDKPDIYHLVLDGMAREDTLGNLYNMDISGFTDELKGLGFCVSQNSTTNYCQTGQALTATLSLNYAKYQSSPTDSDHDEIVDTFSSSTLAENIVNQMGYQSYLVDNDFYETRMRDSDYLIETGYFSRFLKDYYNSSFLSYFYQPKNTNSDHANLVENQFASIEEISKHSSVPKYVYTHIINPHPAFIFDENGLIEKRANDKYALNEGREAQGDDTKAYREAYGKQLEYDLKLLSRTIEEIIKSSKDKPIIIIQSDHGPASTFNWSQKEGFSQENYKERMRNFVAVLTPNGSAGCHQVDEISNVNIYRYVFNAVFNFEMPILENKSYFSDYNLPYKLEDVTEIIRKL